MADILTRAYLENEPNNPKALNFLGLISNRFDLPQFSQHYFSEAAKYAPDWEEPRVNLMRFGNQLQERAPMGGQQSNLPGLPERYLLIKAWGYGFWSDVCHVLGQLLVAEITGRTPVVHWGSNSLFGDDAGVNAFEHFFETISESRVEDLQTEDFDIWPPKWNQRNLTEGEINKWGGEFSRVYGVYLLGRPERVVVSDFHTGVVDLKPWIPIGHHLHGLSVDELYRYLVRRYLRPSKAVADTVDRYFEESLASTDFLAVHVRGSDKVIEMNNIDQVKMQYKEVIDRYLADYNFQKIFMMTDDSRILEYFRELYGNKIIFTDCRRTNSAEGIHYQAVPIRRQLGIEVAVDAYIAARARVFIGNGLSNPSLIVRYLKDWPEQDIFLFDENMYHLPGASLHDW